MEPDEKTGQNVCWTAPLGDMVYNTPVVAGGRVYIGSSNAGYNEKYPRYKTDLGCVVCLNEESGELVWQYSVPKRPHLNGRAPVTAWRPLQAICSAPCIDRFRHSGGRLWLVNNLAEVVCLDVDGFANGNDGPVTDETDAGPQDADVIWRFDMFNELDVRPGLVACTSPTLAGNVLLLNSTHSMAPVMQGGGNPKSVDVSTDVPSFIALHCDTGELLWQNNSATANLLDVNWSSPAFDVIAGVPQAVFAGGDGWLYSFDVRNIAEGSIKVFQSERQLHFAVYYGGFLSCGMSGEYTDYHWRHNGHLYLKSSPLGERNDTRKLAVEHLCDDPQSVLLDGQRYDLRNGRLFAVELQGPPRQLRWNKRFQKAGNRVAEHDLVAEVAAFVGQQRFDADSTSPDTDNEIRQ